MKHCLFCKLFGHSFNKQPDRVENRPCDKWDNCNIEEHRINVLYFSCKHCTFIKIVRNLITLYRERDAK